MPIIAPHVSELSGYAPALLTPFDDGNIELTASEQFCHRLIQEFREDGEAPGADSGLAVVPCFAPGLGGTIYLACRQGRSPRAQRRAASAPP